MPNKLPPELIEEPPFDIPEETDVNENFTDHSSEVDDLLRRAREAQKISERSKQPEQNSQKVDTEKIKASEEKWHGKQNVNNGKNNIAEKKVGELKDKAATKVRQTAKQAVKRTAQAAKKAATQAAKWVAKQAAAMAAKVAATAVGSGVIVPVLIVIAVILIIVLIIVGIIMLSNFQGVTGTGVPQYPQTQAQYNLLKELPALGKDPSASKDTVLRIINATKAQLNKDLELMKTTLGSNSPKIADAENKLKAINIGLDNIIKTQPPSPTSSKTVISAWTKLVNDTVLLIIEFEKILPMGERIASIAEKYEGTSSRTSGNTPNIFGGPDGVQSCAAYVNYVMKEAGAINFTTLSATELWDRMTNADIIINKGGSLDKNLLKRGDIVWFGSEAGTTGRFNHVGIYLGGEMVAANSSTQQMVRIRDIVVHKGKNIFAGAKRIK